jgi:hypothetical protein
MAESSLPSTSGIGKERASVKLILDLRPENIMRTFDSSLDKTEFGRAHKQIRSNKSRLAIEKAVRQAIGYTESNLEDELGALLSKKTLTGKRPVPWYIYQFFDTLRRNRALVDAKRFLGYAIIIKGCKDRYFLALEAIGSNEIRAMVKPPYFRPPFPSPNSSLEANITGFADILFFLAPKIEEIMRLRNPKERKQKLSNLLNWFRIELEFDSKRIPRVGPITLDVRPTVAVDKWISIPSTAPEPRRVLVSSPNVRTAVENLSEAWLNPVTKSVLLSAFTGSGKEPLVGLLAAAKEIEEDNKFVFSAAAVGDFETIATKLANRLAVLESKDGTESEAHRRPVMLFLDEIHHSSAEEVRSGLLRVMESSRYELKNGRTLDFGPVLFVLAASAPPERLIALNPPDLWTRIEYTVIMKHPLLIKEHVDRVTILRDYFEMFWARSVEQWKRTKGEIAPLAVKLKSSDVISSLSDDFAEELSSPLIRLISMRILRTMVYRLFYRTVDHVRLDPLLRDPMKPFPQDFHKEFRAWIVNLSLELILEPETQGIF